MKGENLYCKGLRNRSKEFLDGYDAIRWDADIDVRFVCDCCGLISDKGGQCPECGEKMRIIDV
jgi:rubrerythrin